MTKMSGCAVRLLDTVGWPVWSAHITSEYVYFLAYLYEREFGERLESDTLGQSKCAVVVEKSLLLPTTLTPVPPPPPPPPPGPIVER